MATDRVKKFEIPPGSRLGKNYETIECIGSGWEGEVYLVREKITGIRRAAKLFFPHRNIKNRAALTLAEKLNRLRHCPIVTQYHGIETLRIQQQDISMVLTEYIDGELLSNFLSRQPRQALHPFSALHLLYSLVCGLEQIHAKGEYHGDLHTDNIIVEGYGLNFHVKVLDLFYWKARRHEVVKDDLANLIYVFYEALGGKKYYSSYGPEIKNIVNGLKRSLLFKKFKSMGALKNHLELLRWEL